SHLGTGCATDAYADYTADNSLTIDLIAGEDYDFKVTHGTSSQYVRIWIDFDGDGDFNSSDEFVYESTSAGSTTSDTDGTFSIPSGLVSSSTVLRVKNVFSTGTADACTQSGAYGEVHDYKVNIIGSTAVCESSREEVIATVGNSGDITVNEPLPYTDSGKTED